jgi:hypothetical protein
LIIDTTKQQTTIVLSSAVFLSGNVIFPVGLMPRDVYVSSFDISTGSQLNSVYLNATGYYFLLPIPSGTATGIAVFFYYGNSQGRKSFNDVTISADTFQNFVISGGLWSGTVVGTDGAPVSGVTVSGNNSNPYDYNTDTYKYDQNTNNTIDTVV